MDETEQTRAERIAMIVGAYAKAAVFNAFFSMLGTVVLAILLLLAGVPSWWAWALLSVFLHSVSQTVLGSAWLDSHS